jgi:hypothetical protein
MATGTPTQSLPTPPPAPGAGPFTPDKGVFDELGDTSGGPGDEAGGELPFNEAPGAGWGDEWQSVWEQHNAQLDDLMSQTYSEEARMGRGAAAMNAMSGRGVGGGYGGGQMQANIAGAQMRQQAKMDWMRQGLQLRQDYLNKLYTDAEREDNQEMMDWIQQMQDQSALDVAALNVAGEPVAPEPEPVNPTDVPAEHKFSDSDVQDLYDAIAKGSWGEGDWEKYRSWMKASGRGGLSTAQAKEAWETYWNER